MSFGVELLDLLKQMMKNRIFFKAVSILTGVSLGVSLVSMAFADFEAYTQDLSASGTDTIAGFNSLVKSSYAGSGANIVFKVDKPDYSVVELPAKAGLDGVATLDLSDFHTRKAGEYKVSAKFQGVADYGTVSTFNVMPGEVSETYSEVTPTEQVVRIGRELGEVEVTLRDVFENPIEGHMVELIPSRSDDTVYTDTGLTDNSGSILFTLDSGESGVSTYTVYDLTSNKVLSERTKVAYFESNEELFSNTQAYIGHAVGSSSGPVAYLAFDDLPEAIKAGESVSFTLDALDESNQGVTDYEGVVHFSVVSGEALAVNLPSDYTFVPQDLGSHAFALALSFTSAGTYAIEASDLADSSVFGTVLVTVASASGSANDLISLGNPVAGTYSNNVQVVSGTATPGASIVIFDNDVNIGIATATATGEFMFTTGFLTDGDHKLYAATVNEAGVITASSTKVELKIDTTAPEFEKAELTPSGALAAGATVDVKVYAESGLAQVLVDVDGNVYETEDSGSGFYAASIKAPLIQGTYPVKITLVDLLGNQTKVDDASVMTVGSGGGAGVTGGAIGDVSGVIAYPGDHQVTLSWTPPSSGGPVQFYRVYYGLSANQLQYAVDTWSAGTSWYVPDLKNGIEYFFAVVAVDNSGKISAHMSNIVSGVPGSVVSMPPPDVLNGTAGAEQLQQMSSDVSDTGPEVLWLFLAAVLGGLFYSYSSSKRSAEEAVEDL